MEKIHSLTGMMDLVGKKTDKSEVSNRIFFVEKVLRNIFERTQLSNKELRILSSVFSKL